MVKLAMMFCLVFRYSLTPLQLNTFLQLWAKASWISSFLIVINYCYKCYYYFLILLLLLPLLYYFSFTLWKYRTRWLNNTRSSKDMDNVFWYLYSSLVVINSVHMRSWHWILNEAISRLKDEENLASCSDNIFYVELVE